MEVSNDRLYTYEDYLSWPDDVRYELINGVAYMLAAPSREHQEISRELIRQLANFLLKKPCKVYAAPFDVRLNADKGKHTVVQPDLVVVCDKSKLDSKGCNGAPDMVIEILSPSNSSNDILLKFNLYLQAGVREYWIVDPERKTVAVHILKSGEYVTKYYGPGDTVSVYTLDGCAITLADVFAE